MELFAFIICPYLDDNDYISLSKTSKATREGCRKDYSVRRVKKINDYLPKTNSRLDITGFTLYKQTVKNGLVNRIHTLNLGRTQITDVSMLGHVHTLNLRGTEVTDVSMLGNVRCRIR